MSGIVVITTKGGSKRDFINTLQQETGGAVALVVLQNVKKKGTFKRVLSFYRKVGFLGIIPEIYYFLIVKLSPHKRRALAVLSSRSRLFAEDHGYSAKTMQTDDVNEDSIYARVREIHPEIIVIWGGYIIKQRLLETAPCAVNMHSGFVPYYRGVNGIENAILNNDFDHIGVTLHYAVPQVDAGEIIKIVSADHRKPPSEFFKTLNDSATKEYLNVVKEILNRGKISSEPQDLARGRNYLLREWTYKKQYILAKKILRWEI